ncbi:4-hydroxy-tetrahydrodipicolinate synthase [Leptobacterium sp. I13]|uniref:4-hydroxy-tetrahydrodipicolinate synthase n=1 Tax=Leptobacterium meishanense TaxID=3128904 RepID=UPI0030ED7C48
MQKLTGTGIALITPFKSDLSVDTVSLKRIVNHVIEGGVEYLVVLGTTAENVTLSKEEKEQVKEIIKKENNSRVPMVLGVGGNNTMAIIEELQSTDLSSYEAILSVSPYYNKPTQEGIYQHYKAIAKTSPIPIILYNVPGRTASNMNPETVMRLANDFKNIIGIKEAAGNMEQALRLLQNKPEDFLIISGDDMMTLPMVLAGGSGVISVIGQGFPVEFSNMVRLGLKGTVKEAYEIHYKMMDIIDMIFEEGNPAGIKALLQTQGLCSGDVRLPLVKASHNLAARIDHYVKHF